MSRIAIWRIQNTNLVIMAIIKQAVIDWEQGRATYREQRKVMRLPSGNIFSTQIALEFLSKESLL